MMDLLASFETKEKERILEALKNFTKQVSCV